MNAVGAYCISQMNPVSSKAEVQISQVFSCLLVGHVLACVLQNLDYLISCVTVLLSLKYLVYYIFYLSLLLLLECIWSEYVIL